MTFHYRNQEFSYSIHRTHRKTLGIYVHPDLTIEVRTSEDTAIGDIQAMVHKRRGWIVRKLRELEVYHPHRTEPIYLNGSTHLYLGRQYRLQILEGTRNAVKIVGGKLEVTVHPESTSEKALQIWYREKADTWYTKLLDEVYPLFKAYDIPKPTVYHKLLRKRWGSCKVTENRLLLNTELIQAPKIGIEYVIAHELTHLIHPHHTTEFYGVMDAVMPEWKKWKVRLEEKMA